MNIPKAKLWFSDNFKNWILSQEPKKLPKAPAYEKHVLPKPMNDGEIISEWKIGPYSVPEFLVLIKALIKKQPKGEDGPLLTNDHANIFYVQLEDRMVAVRVYWYSEYREWRCNAFDLDVNWSDGVCVFSRSPTSQNLIVSDLDGEIIKIKGVEYKLTKLK